MIISGECLKNCFDNIYHIPGRILLGCAHGIAHLAVISYASEATTNSIRTGLLSLIAVINGISTLFAVRLAREILNLDQYQNNISATETEDIPIVSNQTTIDIYVIISISGIIIAVMAFLALILAIFINRESIPFLIRKNKYDEAYDEYVILHSSSNASNLRFEFEIWKNDILIDPRHCANIFHKDNTKLLLWLVIKYTPIECTL